MSTEMTRPFAHPIPGRSLDHLSDSRGALSSITLPLVAVLTLFLICQRGPAFADELDCKRVHLKSAPAWISSATWSVDGSHLLVVDAFSDAILTFDLAGNVVDKIVAVSSSKNESFLPSIIRIHKGGYLLENEDGIILSLDKKLEESGRRIELRGLTNEEGDRIGGVFDWTALGDELLVYADIENNGKWRGGFLRIPRTEPSTFIVLSDIEDRAGREMHHLGFQYLTAATLNTDSAVEPPDMDPSAVLPDTGFFLRMCDPPEIYRYSKGGDAAERLGVAKSIAVVARRPKLPSMQGGTPSIANIYRSIERAEMPVAIHGVGKSLYLLNRKLTKERSGDGTDWSLLEVNPDDQVVTGKEIPIPTDANHLLAVPGRETWAFFEKGEVRSLGQQRIDTLLLIPADWIEEDSSPLEALANSGGQCK
ncbi:MAG: hypothetical protein GY854_22380 [Deltaproteobacteria bacterium]|nr:hypothetical protein [Deltaproteobacteria bacterium]